MAIGGLGSGLDSLFSDNTTEVQVKKTLRITEIEPNREQPRKNFSDEAITALAESIRDHGMLQPILVRPMEDGSYRIVAGERRWRAARMLGLDEVPVNIKEMTDTEAAQLSLIENLQMENLNPVEEAMGFKELIEKYGMTQESAAIRLGLAQSTVANKLRILKLNAEERKIILDNNMSERHARALLKITDNDRRLAVLNKAAESGWTVDTLEKYIAKLLKEDEKRASYHKRAAMLKDVRLFFNSVNKAIDVMRLAGVNADAKRIDHEDYIEYIIKIPSEKQAE